jgi:hypothetical protein
MERSEFESHWDQELSLLNVVQTDSGAHPVSYPMDSGALFLGVERPGREADHSPATGAEVKHESIHPLFHAPSWRKGLIS